MTPPPNPAPAHGPAPAAPLLDVAGLRVSYGGVVAVDGVTLQLPPHPITGLIGPNGAGKTTFIDAITGYAPVAAGTVTFAGRDVTALKVHERARLGLVRTFQSVELFEDMTVREHLLAAARSSGALTGLGQLVRPETADGLEAVGQTLSLLGLDGIADRSVRELSAGHRTLVGIARALACRPRLLLLDEPGAGLDTRRSAELRARLRAIADGGLPLLLVDHDMGLVLSICDRVIVMNFGRVIGDGPPEAIRRERAVIDAYLGGRSGGARGPGGHAA